MRKVFTLLLVLILLLSTTSCSSSQDEDIYIVFTNDVHCAIDGNLGYSSVAALKKELKSQHKYVALVDVGDFSSGSTAGTLTNGRGLTEIMNSVEYDVAALGNHEFDYQIDNLVDSIISNANFDVVCSNISYNGEKENLIDGVINPYVIKEFGNTKVAFVGVTAPNTIVESNPRSFKEDDKVVYDFLFGDVEENFYNHLQAIIDEAHSKADYVIVLSHCGIAETCAPFRSIDICENTYNVDVILDGHSHSQITGRKYMNVKGEKVQIWQTGTQLSNIGELILTKDHTIEGLLISEYDKKDETVDNAIVKLNSQVNEKTKEIIGHTDFDLTTGITKNDVFLRTVRTRETNLGDLVADAFRNTYATQIGFVIGGSIRTNINAGDISMKDIFDVLPFANYVCVAKIKGQTILDALEYSAHSTLASTDDGEASLGEFGGFLQVSGIKYIIDTSIPSPVVMDGENFGSIDGQRRVSDVYVQDGDEWLALQSNEEYTVATVDYVLIEGGDGYTMFNDNIEIVSKDGLMMGDCFAEYISSKLNGTISQEYFDAQERIIVK